MPKYDIDVTLTDGNAYAIMGAVRLAMRRAKTDRSRL